MPNSGCLLSIIWLSVFILPLPIFGEKDWDYLILSQRWPGTLCTFTKCDKVPTKMDFVIHGLWPTVYPDAEPESCEPAPSFNETNLDPIKEELRRFWPNLLAGKTEHQFWKHEWDHHGRCALENNRIKNEYDYFRVSLDLRQRLDLLTKLAKLNIRPSNETELKVEDIQHLLHKIYGVHASLYCLKRHSEIQRLFEVRFCFSSTFDYIDCHPKNECLHPLESTESTNTCSAISYGFTPELGQPYSAQPCVIGPVIFPDLKI